MPKFILIDHSIREYGGHYYEYAINVLEAAKGKGYEIFLATNKDFKFEANDKNFTVLPEYIYDFWGLKGKKKVSNNILHSMKNIIKSKMFKVKLNFKYSRLGYIFQSKRANKFSILANEMENIYMVFLALLIMPFYYLYKIIKDIYNLIKVIFTPLSMEYPRRLIKSMMKVVNTLFSPVIVPVKYCRNIGKYLSEFKRQNSFAKSTHNLFKKIPLNEGDIIFIPTLSEIDMLGLLKYINKTPKASLATWHLVFRRNIFEGREPEYVFQLSKVKELRNKFELFHSKNKIKNVFFYTDTEKLTYQYNALNTIEFNTIPIPINAELQTKNYLVKTEPFRITYLGDARREKGYQYLPYIVEELMDEYVNNGKCIFEFQSNFSFKKPQDNADVFFARNKLESFEGESVVLHKKALNSKEYSELVKRGDIGLLFYDRNNYYARSSGALVEALSMAMPVIVPSASWLSEQIMPSIYSYHQKIIKDMNLLNLVYGLDMNWVNKNQKNNKKYSSINGKQVIFGGKENNVHASLNVIEGCRYLLIKFDFDKLIPIGTYVKTKIVQYDKDDEVFSMEYDNGKLSERHRTCSILVPIKDEIKKITITYYNSFGNIPVCIENVELAFYKGFDNKSYPIGAVGLVYSNADEITFLLKDIIENYSHYYETAQSFSNYWIEKHSAEKLIQSLEENSILYRGARISNENCWDF